MFSPVSIRKLVCQQGYTKTTLNLFSLNLDEYGFGPEKNRLTFWSLHYHDEGTDQELTFSVSLTF